LILSDSRLSRRRSPASCVRRRSEVYRLFTRIWIYLEGQRMSTVEKQSSMLNVHPDWLIRSTINPYPQTTISDQFA
jgi:hypothetical protein